MEELGSPLFLMWLVAIDEEEAPVPAEHDQSSSSLQGCVCLKRNPSKSKYFV